MKLHGKAPLAMGTTEVTALTTYPAYELACKKRATYRAATLLVAMLIMKPTRPTQMGPVMCRNC